MSAAAASGTSLVQVARTGGLLAVTLNRPRALNALNLDMVRELAAGPYAMLQADDACRVLLLRGAGGKAFCAGGDMKALALDAMQDGDVRRHFFAHEYALNAAIAESAKPQVAVWDGIVMGGGVGLSIHGRFRVATERTLFAMPETAIGFFPDVGASHFFQRLPRATANYLALTGARLGARDACTLGLATHYVPSVALARLEEELGACTDERDVDACITRLGGGAEPPASATEPRASVDLSVAANAPQIAHCFGAETVGGMLARLEASTSEWAAETIGTLRARSPVALVATLGLLRRAATERMPLRECLAREYELAQRVTDVHGGVVAKDFFEGIRAVLIEKDHSPAWSIPLAELTASKEAEIDRACFGSGDSGRADDHNHALIAATMAQLRGGSAPSEATPASCGKL